MRWIKPVGALVAMLALSSAPAAADWRSDLKVLRVGIVAPLGAARDTARIEPFRAYLEAKLGLPVEVVAAATYSALVDAQASARVQYAIHTASSFVTASVSCACVEPLALPAAIGGARGFRALLVARSDGSLRSLADAKGKRLALSGDDSVAGRLVPLKGLARQGIDPQTYFSAVLTAEDPEDAVTMLFTDEADLAVAWSSLEGNATAGYSFGSLARMVSAGTLAMDQIRVVWQSPLIPFGPHAVRRDLPSGAKALLGGALAAMATEAPDALDAVDGRSIGGGGFVPVDAAAYAVIEELVKADPARAKGG
jgi:phosphonate transport system substrate-binding protein